MSGGFGFFSGPDESPLPSVSDLPAMHPTETASVAGRSDITPELIDALAAYDDEQIATSLAMNHRTPSAVLNGRGATRTRRRRSRTACRCATTRPTPFRSTSTNEAPRTRNEPPCTPSTVGCLPQEDHRHKKSGIASAEAGEAEPWIFAATLR
jgi:hypothetical protein